MQGTMSTIARSGVKCRSGEMQAYVDTSPRPTTCGNEKSPTRSLACCTWYHPGISYVELGAARMGTLGSVWQALGQESGDTELAGKTLIDWQVRVLLDARPSMTDEESTAGVAEPGADWFVTHTVIYGGYRRRLPWSTTANRRNMKKTLPVVATMVLCDTNRNHATVSHGLCRREHHGMYHSLLRQAPRRIVTNHGSLRLVATGTDHGESWNEWWLTYGFHKHPNLRSTTSIPVATTMRMTGNRNRG